jgi:DNA-binding GntR family transcriptional regulator
MIALRPAGAADATDDVSSTVATRIERAIRAEIIAGAIPPGARLRIADLAERFGVSHIPIREALRQLEADRLVVIESHKGAVLRQVDRKFVIDVHDTREAIEALLVRNATLNATPAECRELSHLVDDYEAAAALGDQDAMVKANRRFHRFIASVADNPEAAQILDRGWELVISLANTYGRGPTRVAAIIDQHRRLVQAISARDPALAVAVVQEHCGSAKQDLLAQMDRAAALSRTTD